MEKIKTIITVRQGGKVIRQREFMTTPEKHISFCEKHIEKGYQAKYSEVIDVYTRMVKLVRSRRTTISVDSKRIYSR